MEAEVIAVHGWGYSSAVWARWTELFRGKATFQSFDRGYFGSSHPVGWSREHRLDSRGLATDRILLLHSMAPLFLPAKLIEEATVVVLFAAFRHFHPETPGRAADHSKEFLTRMRDALKEDPWKVLESFHRRCGGARWGGAIAGARKEFPGREGHLTAGSAAIARSDDSLNLPLLAEDLDRLDSEAIDFSSFRRVPRVLILHGTGDRIVSHSSGETLAHSLGGSATFLSIDGAGHALPFTHADEIMRMIGPVITSVETR